MDTSSLEQRTIRADSSYLREARSHGASMPDFQAVFAAQDIDPKRQTPVTATKAVLIEGKPLFWFAPDFKAAVLDCRWFTDLKRADPPRLSTGQSVVLGAFLGGPVLPPRALAWFLMEAGIILTYAHIEATVSLSGEKDDGSSYEAVFAGTHVYFTNDRNEDSYGFKLRLDQKTGAITVTGA